MRVADNAHDAAVSSGKVPYAIGQASTVRIPIPGTGGLCIELTPRGRLPPAGSTSTLFFQDTAGRRQLRLDYGFNPVTKTIDYHWNQRGTHAHFGIAGHSPAGAQGQAAYRAAKYFRFAGRVVFVFGAAVDGVSIVFANRPIRRASEVVAAWAGAWIGCKGVGAGGAVLGTAVTPGLGTAFGGFTGCTIGGFGGYVAGSSLAGGVFDWAEDTAFLSLSQVKQP